jgi:hypothetical protein
MTPATGFHLDKKNSDNMEQRIRLAHPAGKNAVSMSKSKYDIIKKAILKCLAKKRTLSHTEMLNAINDDFKKNKIIFEGSVEWYMESVKLDLEANKIIIRQKEKSKLKFKLT